MRRIFLVVALAATSAAWGQKIADPKPFAASITAADLKKHLYIVASAEMEGRETATEGQRKAASYIENHFKSLGLIPGNNGNYQLGYPVFQDSLINATIEVNGKRFELNTDVSINLNMASSGTMMCGEVVFAGYGISDSSRRKILWDNCARLYGID